LISSGDVEQMDKLNRRLVKVTKVHNDECKQLLALMGIPFVEVGTFFLPLKKQFILICFYLKAPCEAEAQCAALVKADKVYAIATEDMDSLTFGSKVLLRYMTYSEAKKMPIKEFYLERVLEAMEYTMDEVKLISVILNIIIHDFFF